MSEGKVFNGDWRGKVDKFSRYRPQCQASRNELDCEIHVVANVKRQLHLHGLLIVKHTESLLENIKEGKLILLNKSVSGLVCIEKFFKEMEVITYHIQNIPHVHDLLEMISEKQRELYSDSRQHLSANVHEPEKVTSSIRNKYFTITQR